MSNWMTIEVLPVLLVLVSSDTPGISPRRRSSGDAMLAAMVSGSAPGRPAKTTMVGMSTLGSGATGRKRTATRPISRIPTARRIVATGRRMNGAEKFTSAALALATTCTSSSPDLNRGSRK